jgi:hypothetical protein
MCNMPSESKPLPAIPYEKTVLVTNLDAKPLPPKPLPALPEHVTQAPNYRRTLLLIAALGVWFLLIVVLLPVIMERDAMLGLNRWLRHILSRLGDLAGWRGKTEL